MNLLSSMKRAYGVVKFTGRKYAPEILLAGGVILGGVALYEAIKETTRVEDIIDEHKDAVEEIKLTVEEAQKVDEEEDWDTTLKGNILAQYLKTGWKLIYNYKGMIIMSLGSVVMVLTSHGLLKKRYLAIGATAASLLKANQDINKRLVDELGEEKARHFMYGTETQTIEREVVDDKGRTKVKKVKVETLDPVEMNHPFARIFDKGNTNYEKNTEFNRNFLASVQAWAQGELVRKGYLYLNEVYERLGFEKTIAGWEYGWVFDDISGTSESAVVFSCFDTTLMTERDEMFFKGEEEGLLIDFNCVHIKHIVPLAKI